MCDKSDWDRYKNRCEPNLSNVLNPEGIDITLDRMIISQIQLLVERYLIHRLLIFHFLCLLYRIRIHLNNADSI